jgi:hypothetical protein
MFYFLIFLVFSCSKDIDTNSLPETAGEVASIVKEFDEPESVADSTSEDEISNENRTKVTIVDKQFYINGELTYKGRYWQGRKIEGLLMNSRMVQGIFDDTNRATRQQFVYPDTNVWDPERNTNEFISQMSEWKKRGLLAFTLNLQGGSPTGYGNNKPWINSAFNSDGHLIPSYRKRLERILNEADRLQMVVILGYFYFGQDQVLKDETAILNAVDNITYWILEKGYQNILVEVNNECNLNAYDHDILGENRIHELVQRVKNTERNGQRLLVSTSYSGGTVPSSQVINDSDYILIHGNGVKDPNRLRDIIRRTRNVEGGNNKPIVINEDDHFDFDKTDYNFLAAIDEYASWGYFDFRKPGEGYKDGVQSVPVDWGINSERKRNFFDKLKEITGQ